VAKEYIDQHGGWVRDTRENCYNDACLPLPALRVLAGVSKDRGSYYIARDAIKPCDELLDMVFPSLKKTEEEFRQRADQDTAGIKFLGSLRLLAKVSTIFYRLCLILICITSAS
jgi:hypothetical protein